MDLPVVIEKVVYKNDRGFAVLAVSLNPYSSIYKPEMEDLLLKNIKPNSYNNFAVSVNMLNPHERVEGGQYIATGNFFNHPKFGMQFKGDFLIKEVPKNDDGLRIYLETSLPNIGPIRAKDIVKKFGVAETIRILDEEPMKLSVEINGITERRVAPIKEAWDRDKALRELFVWLNEHQISPEIGKKIYAMWKEESLKILVKNPYRLVEIPHIGFLRADFIAHKIFKNIPKDLRAIACMQYTLEEDLHKNSNLCMPYNGFIASVMESLKKGSEQNGLEHKFEEEEYKKLIPECIKKNLNIFTAVKNMHEESNGAYIYLKKTWDKEKYIATNIYHRRSVEKVKLQEENSKDDKENSGIVEEKENDFSCTDEDIEKAEKDIKEFSKRDVKLDDCQKEAIRSALENKMTVITGGAGTGKSTICRCICFLAQEKNLSIRLMSPTGKAARVLGDKTGFTAETIHRSLKMKPDSDFPGEVIKEDIILIDEASMVGVDTMFAVMSAMEENMWGHLVFVGDSKQLPSVSPGKFLSDIMESNCANVVKLDRIYRQDENSYIPLLANDIANGKVVDIPKTATDIKWHNLDSLKDFASGLRNIIKDFISENNIDDLQIISPMYKVSHGLIKINEIVQDFMAEENGVKDSPFTRSFQRFFVGDRVVQCENNYDKSIFNGDIGKIIEVGRKIIDPSVSDEQKDFVTVDFYGNGLTYMEDEIEELKLAWALSVHKFQGSESPYVIFILSNENLIMAGREIVYTAITRARKKLDIYGHMSIFRLSPTKSVLRKRYTNMNNIITELRESRKMLKILE